MGDYHDHWCNGSCGGGDNSGLGPVSGKAVLIIFAIAVVLGLINSILGFLFFIFALILYVLNC